MIYRISLVATSPYVHSDTYVAFRLLYIKTTKGSNALIKINMDPRTKPSINTVMVL